MNKVYVLFEGSIPEGGGVNEIYGDKEKAIKFGLMLVEQKNERVRRIHVDNPEPYLFKDVTEEHHRFNETTVKSWESTIEHITIYTYEVQ